MNSKDFKVIQTPWPLNKPKKNLNLNNPLSYLIKDIPLVLKNSNNNSNNNSQKVFWRIKMFLKKEKQLIIRKMIKIKIIKMMSIVNNIVNKKINNMLMRLMTQLMINSRKRSQTRISHLNINNIRKNSSNSSNNNYSSNKSNFNYKQSNRNSSN